MANLLFTYGKTFNDISVNFDKVYQNIATIKSDLSANNEIGIFGKKIKLFLLDHQIIILQISPKKCTTNW